MKKLLSILSISTLLFTFSCRLNSKNEKNLNYKDLQFMQQLGILDPNEKVLLFESNGGFSGIKQSGNFVTEKRVASYWIEKDQSTLNFAYYPEIDSLKLNDKSHAFTLSSSITVYRNDKTSFELYIDADSSRLNQFYQQTIELWKKNN